MPWAQVNLQFSQSSSPDRKRDGWGQLRQHDLQLVAVHSQPPAVSPPVSQARSQARRS